MVRIALLTLAAWTFNVNAAPFAGMEVVCRQPNGRKVKLKVFGDEFHSFMETRGGLVVVRDPKTKYYCYAKLSADRGSYVSTGIRLGTRLRKVSRLAKRIRINAEARKKIADRARKALGCDKNGRIIMPAPSSDGPKLAATPPGIFGINQVLGNRKGLMLLVQFPDLPAPTVTKSEVEKFCNEIPFTGERSATSIRGYFKLQSNNKLDLQHVVTDFFVAPEPLTYYQVDPPASETPNMWERIRILMRQRLEQLKAQGFDFRQCDADNDGKVDVISLFYSGGWQSPLGGWASGFTWSGFKDYGLDEWCTMQVSPLYDPAGPVVLHELGHAVCGFPDLYPYSGSATNMGGFSLMAGGTWSDGGYHVSSIVSPMKYQAGWTTIIDASPTGDATYTLNVDQNTFVRLLNPSNPKEYYMFEMRAKTGYEGAYGQASSVVCPSEGLVIYHVHEDGSSSSSSIFTEDNPNCDYSTPYRVMLLEKNPTTAITPWYDDPSPDSNDAFTNGDHIGENTFPRLAYWSGNGRTIASGVSVGNIQVGQSSLTFRIGDLGEAPEIQTAWASPATIDFQDSTTLSVVASDPDGDPLTYSWSKVSGPGMVTFSTQSEQTDAYFTLNGTYVVRAAVSDGMFTVTSDLTITVTNTTVGLWFGELAGEVDTPNPKTELLIDVSLKTEDKIANDTTEVFTGQIYDADGNISFTENIDDKTRIWIDGVLVLNDSNWQSRASTANLELYPGWHNIEIRIYNGYGGSGPYTSPGIGFDPNGGSNWQTLVDPGDGSLLRPEGDISANTTPVASNQNVSVPEDDSEAITLSATDADGHTLTYSVVSQPTKGTLTGTAPNLTYTPDTNYVGTDNFTFKANDGWTDSNVATISITVTSTNRAPVAANQSVSVPEDGSKAITLSATDADGDSLSYVVVAQPQHGALSGNPPNVTYTPDAGYVGTDSFTFKANDGRLDSNTATISITVTNTNDAPVIESQPWANPDTIDISETTTLQVQASDPDGDVLSYTWNKVTGPGTLSVTTQTASTTASFSEAGEYTVRVTISDGTMAVTGDVIVMVTEQQGVLVGELGILDLNANNGINPATNKPWKAGDKYRFIFVSSATTTAESNDLSTYDNFVQGLSNAQNIGGTWKVIGSSGTADARDHTGTNSTSSTGVGVFLLNGSTIIAANNADLWNGLSTPVNLDELGNTLTGSTHTGTNVDGTKRDRHLGGSDESPAKVTIGKIENAGRWLVSYNAAATTKLHVYALSEPLTVKLEATANQAPVASNSAVTTAEDTAKAITLPVTDADSDPLTYTIVTQPAHGTLSGTAPNLTYTPAANYNGSDSLTFKANDGTADSNTATVSITVTSVNDAPVITTAAAANPGSIDLGATTTLSVAANDIDGDTLSYNWSKVSGPGTLTVATQAASTTASFSAAGEYTVRVTVSDGTAQVTSDVSVTVTEGDGVLVGELGILDLQANNGINPTTNQPWKAGDKYRFIFVSSATTTAESNDLSTYDNFVQGLANAQSIGGTWKVVGSSGTTDARDHTGTNPTSNTGVGVFLLDGATIIANNNADLWNGLSTPVNRDELGNILTGSTHTGTNGNGTKRDRHLGGSDESPAKVTIGKIENAGRWMVSYNATTTTKLRVYAISERLTVKTEAPANTAPVAAAQSISLDQDTSKAIALSATDADGDALSYTVVTAPTKGTLTGNPPNVTYASNPGYFGNDSFTFKANDGQADSNTATVSITINEVEQSNSTTITGTDGGNDSWNTASNWDAGTPGGEIDVIVGNNVTATVSNAATPAYTGTLTIGSNATLAIAGSTGTEKAVTSASKITLNAGAVLSMNMGLNLTLAPITLKGDAMIDTPVGASDWQTTNFDTITGAHKLNLKGFNGHVFSLNKANTFGELVSIARDRHRIYAKAAGALGTGNVTINGRADGRSAQLHLDVANTIADTATLTLNGKGFDNGNDDRITISAGVNEVVKKLIVGGVTMPAGTYDKSAAWLSGEGTLTVTSN